MLKASLSIVLAALNCTLISAGNLSGAMPSQAVTAGGNRIAAGEFEQTTSSDTSQSDGGVPDGPVFVDVDPNAPIQPRVPLAKMPVRGPGSLESMVSPDTPRSGFVVFKIRDDLKARTDLDFGTQLHSGATSGVAGLAPGLNTDRELDDVRAVLSTFGATIRQNIRIPATELAAMEARAREISRSEQPDLAGLLVAKPATPAMQVDLAEALNALPSVEFAHIQYMPVPAQSESCRKDTSLQKGGATAGSDVLLGNDCTTFQDANGVTQNCNTPPPVFIGFPVIGPLGDTVYRALPAPTGVIPCHAADRWYGFSQMPLTATGCGTQNAIYTVNPAQVPSTFDCTPNCNQGGGVNGLCVQPPTGYQSIQACQFGCQDSACAAVVAGQGFTMCTDQTQNRGWDALCATIANIYCSGSSGGPTPYRVSGPFEPSGAGGWLADPATASCYDLAQQNGSYYTDLHDWSFGSGSPLSTDGDAAVYDPCFVLRGPANPPVIDPDRATVVPVTAVGIVSYADVGNGEGIRPWGFSFSEPTASGSRAYANAFLHAEVDITDPLNCSSLFSLTYRVGGSYLWSTNPTDPDNAGLAEYNFSLKSYPYSFSHDCLTLDPVTPGCFQTPCCVYVCTQDPSCCTVSWDTNCVATAEGNADLCRTQSLNKTNFPTGVDDGTPDFRYQDVDAGAGRDPARVVGLQTWNAGNPVVNSCLEYINNNPTATPGLINISEIASQNELRDTKAFINCGFGGGGLPAVGLVRHALAGYKVPARALHGAGHNVGVIDYSAFVNHQALIGRVSVEPGQTIVLVPSASASYINPDHGTAVLGILVANLVPGMASDPSGDGFGGIRGLLTPDPADPEDQGANAIFFPGVSVQEGGRIPTAIARAGQMLNPGDVLCIPLSYNGNYNTGLSVTVSGVPETNLLLSVARSLGITNVVAAGNGAFQSIIAANSNSNPLETYSVVVGACWPGYQVPQTIGASVGGTVELNCPANTFPGERYCRYRESNWTPIQGPRANGFGIDVAAWGTGLCTLGRGDLWNGDNFPDNPTVGGAPTYSSTDLTENRLRSYQSNFSGTSGAAAMIAGLAVNMQGFSESFFGSPVSPTRIRQILANQRDNGDGTISLLGSCVLQCGGTPGTALPNSASDSPIVVKNGDLLTNGGNAHEVGGFPRATNCLDEVAATIFNSGGTPFDLTVVKGTVRSGNNFSCARLDNGFLKIQAVRSARGSTGQGYGPPFAYAANGLVTDVQLRANTRLQNPTDLTNMQISAYGAATAANQNSNSSQNNALTMIYVYNKVSRRWNWLALNYLTNQVPALGATPLNANLAMTWQPVTNYLIAEGTQQVVYFRVITYPFGIIGPYQTWWDFFDIQTNPVLPR